MLSSCDVGRLSCGVLDATRDDSDVETLSLYSAAMSRRSFGGLSSIYDEPSDEIDGLKKRILFFQSRGWLSQQEQRKYMDLLSITPNETSNHFTCHVVKELVKELDDLEDKMQAATIRKQTRNKRPGSETVATAACPDEFKNFPQSEQTRKFQEQERRTSPRNNGTSKSPSFRDPQKLGEELSDADVSEMFVETSLFARLGYVQPPCCMRCAYRESMKEASSNPRCSRWIVWRKNGKEKLSPSNMSENTIAIQCHAARALVAGKLVENYKWDSNGKTLLLPRMS